jgi:hypothetical protein
MSLHSWLHNLRSALAPGRGQRHHRRRGSLRAARHRPNLEVLEDRTLPSTFTVLNLADSGAGSLRQAVQDANSPAFPGPDVIRFAPAVRGTIGLTSGQLSITDDLTIDGPGADRVAISGSHQSRIFSISGGATVAIDGLTITEGKAVGAPGLGGGILNTGSTLALAQVVLSNNQAVGAPGEASRGGAVANVSGAMLTVTDSLFTQNQALGGAASGAINFSGSGGGILNFGSRLMVSRSAFIANQALGGTGGGPARGGGIDTTNGSTATITDSTFLGNQAIAADGSGGIGFGRGGGLYINAGTVTVVNSTFLGNLARGGSNNTGSGQLVAPAAGAGIQNADSATLFLTGSTIRGNRALGGSGNTSTGGDGDIGTAFGGGLLNAGTATVTESVFEDNETRGGSGNRGDGTSFQFVGTGTGAGIFNSARNSSGEHAILTLSNVTIRHNRAVGGDGNTAGTFVDAGIGGGLATNGSNPFVPESAGSEVTLRNSTIAHNEAVGGHGGAALGGGVANTLGGVVTISGSTLAHNRAQGGDGGPAGDGGQGFGGGIYNGAASTHPSNPGAPTVLTVVESAITHNQAQGGAAGNGGSDGEGIGGGIYNLGLFDVDVFTVINKNKATASHDDLFDPFA